MGSKQLDLYLMSEGTREYTSQIQVTWPLATPLLLNIMLEYWSTGSHFTIEEKNKKKKQNKMKKKKHVM